MLANPDGRPGAYELLAVHPNAPADLIAASYWLLVGQLQERRQRGEYVDDALHELTRAYECISDPDRRSAYDAAAGHALEPLSTRPLPRLRRPLRSRLLKRDVLVGNLDHYEVLGLSRSAPAEALPRAYQAMLSQYLRIPAENKKRLLLLKALDDAYETLSVPDRRQRYDELVEPKANEGEEPAEREKTTVHEETVEHETDPSPGGAAPARSHVQAVPRSVGRALTAGVQLPYRGARAALRARTARSNSHAPAERVVKPPEPEPPISREPPPRPRTYSIDVEEAFLGRIAAHVKDIQSQHPPAESRDGSDTSRRPLSG